MSNADAPRGLVPLQAGAGEIRTNVYYVPNTCAVTIAIGDPVIRNGSGDTLGRPGVTRATIGSGNRVTGVMVGKLAAHRDLSTTPDLEKQELPVSTAGYIVVADDPFQYFYVQADNSVTGASQGYIGTNVSLISAHAFNSINGQSKLEIDLSTCSTDASGQFQLVGFLQRPDNNIGSGHAVWVVKPNIHTELPDGGRTGV